MLVLTRRIGEQVVVPGCEITITVLAVRRNRVRLGITAPTGLSVHRQEVWRRMATAVASQQDGSPPCRLES